MLDGCSMLVQYYNLLQKLYFLHENLNDAQNRTMLLCKYFWSQPHLVGFL